MRGCAVITAARNARRAAGWRLLCVAVSCGDSDPFVCCDHGGAATASRGNRARRPPDKKGQPRRCLVLLAAAAASRFGSRQRLKIIDAASARVVCTTQARRAAINSPRHEWSALCFC